MIPKGVAFVEHDPICGDWDFFARLSKDHPVAYLDLETTHNRSHEDEQRLTRTAWKKQLELRIDMVERLYMRDQSFYEHNKSEVNKVYRHYHHALCRQYFFDGDSRSARAILDKYRSHCRSIDIPYLIMRMATYTPGLAGTLKSLRSLRG
jgi:hypothetical protein